MCRRLRHEIIEFAPYFSAAGGHCEFGISKMLYRPEKIPLLARLREKGLSRIFVGLAVLAMAGWVYLLSSMFLRFVLWCFS